MQYNVTYLLCELQIKFPILLINQRKYSLVLRSWSHIGENAAQSWDLQNRRKIWEIRSKQKTIPM